MNIIKTLMFLSVIFSLAPFCAHAHNVNATSVLIGAVLACPLIAQGATAYSAVANAHQVNKKFQYVAQKGKEYGVSVRRLAAISGKTQANRTAFRECWDLARLVVCEAAILAQLKKGGLFLPSKSIKR